MKLEIKNLSVEIENKKILDKFNMEINSGEIHAIMGPNGVGKSTLSRVIMGDPKYKVIDGEILYDNKMINDLGADERSKLGIFLAMQSPLEIDGLSNQDFLRTAMASKQDKKISMYSFIKECEKSAEELKMNKELIHRSLNIGFSGGEKKKNEVLQIKLLKPSLIILDEIDSGLDVDSLKVVCKNINDYIKEYPETSILIITHYNMILNYLKPKCVHILKEKQIIHTGDFSLVKEIEKEGYDKYTNKGLVNE